MGAPATGSICTLLHVNLRVLLEPIALLSGAADEAPLHQGFFYNSAITVPLPTLFSGRQSENDFLIEVKRSRKYFGHRRRRNTRELNGL